MSTFVEASAPPLERQRTAVSSSLERAQESADRSDYTDALERIRVFEAIGDQIPPDYQGNRRVWGVQLVANSTDRGQS
jgi:hypothetical protein